METLATIIGISVGISAIWMLHSLGEQIVAHLTDLKDAVERNTAVVSSAVTLIQGIAEQLEDAKDDPEEVQALADELNATSQALADAVAANTPAE